jgi:hypothetical protein
VLTDAASMGVIRELAATPRRLALNGASAAAALTLGALAAHQFAKTGWPLADANPRLVAAAALLFLLGFAFKACGWQRLFVPH